MRQRERNKISEIFPSPKITDDVTKRDISGFEIIFINSLLTRVPGALLDIFDTTYLMNYDFWQIQTCTTINQNCDH